MSEHKPWFPIVLIASVAAFVVFLCAVVLYDLSDTKVERVGILPNNTAEVEIVKGKGSININTANEEELMQLPGIGEVRAKNIIEFREANGGFVSITQIKFVDGIGEGIYDSIKDLITVG